MSTDTDQPAQPVQTPAEPAAPATQADQPTSNPPGGGSWAWEGGQWVPREV